MCYHRAELVGGGEHWLSRPPVPFFRFAVELPVGSTLPHVVFVILCLLAFMTIMIMMYMKVQGYKQSFFIDKYFFLLTIFLCGFLWFVVFMWVAFILITRQKWGLDKETVMELTEGQDLAIYYIKDARNFIVHLMQKKKYQEAESIRMEQLIENLTM